MKRENLEKLVKYAKNDMSQSEIIDICLDINKTNAIPRHVVEELSQSDDFGNMAKIAGFCDKDILIDLLEKSEMMPDERSKINLQRMIAKNPNCDEKIFEILYRVCDSEIDVAIARNPSATLKILSKIGSRKKSKRAWHYIAKHKNCSDITLQNLLKNAPEYSGIKQSIINNYKASTEIIRQLFYDDNPEIAYLAAKRLYCVDNLCERLQISDLSADQKVLARATKSKDVLRKLCKSENLGVLYEVIHNKNCPLEEVERFSDSEDESIREFVASKANVSIKLLRKLANDGFKNVRESVAKNTNTPMDILDQLSRDSNRLVRYAVANNANTDDKTLYRMFARDKDGDVMYAAAKNIKTYWIFDIESIMKKRFYYNQLYGLLSNENLVVEELHEILNKQRFSERIDTIVEHVMQRKYIKNVTFDVIVENLNLRRQGNADIISSILQSNMFSDFYEFINMYFD